MSRIFVSYRRDDTQGEAGHLLADLRRRFGDDRVFMDIAAIGPGEEFGPAIERAIAACKVVLVLIGRAWLDARDAQGTRRLDNDNDWVRLEVEAALRGQRLIVPVLVQGATMPAEASLPESMRGLARRNAHEMSARRWDYDFDGLAKMLDAALGAASPATLPAAQPAQAPMAGNPASRLLWPAAVAVAVVLAAGFYFLRNEPAPTAPAPSAAAEHSASPGRRPGAFGTPEFAALKPSAAPAASAGFEKTAGFAAFSSLVAEMAAQPAPSEVQLRRLAWTRDAACALDDARCRQAADQKVRQMVESICRRKVPAAPAGASETVRLRADLDFQGCVQPMSSVMADESLQRAKDVARPVKATAD